MRNRGVAILIFFLMVLAQLATDLYLPSFLNAELNSIATAGLFSIAKSIGGHSKYFF